MIQKRPILEPQALKKLADLCAKGEHLLWRDVREDA